MIRVILKYIFIALFGVFIQSTLAKSGLYSPDCLLVIAVVLAFTMQNISGLFCSFFLGLLSDLSSGVYLGPYAAAYVCAFCFAAAISRRVFADRPLAVISVTFLACIIKSLVFSGFVMYFVDSAPISILSLRIFFFEAVLTSLISPIVFRIFTGKILNKSKSRGASSLSLSRAS